MDRSMVHTLLYCLKYNQNQLITFRVMLWANQQTSVKSITSLVEVKKKNLF